MPVVAAAAIGAGGSLLAANSASKANNKAIAATTAAADQATEEQRRQFDIANQNQQPWLNTGKSALSELAGLYGLNTGGGANASTYAYLQANPGAAAEINKGSFGGPGDLNAAVNWQRNEYGGIMPNNGQVTANGYTAGGATTQGTSSAMAPFFASPDYQFRQNEQTRSLTARNSALGIQDSGAAQKAALQYSGNLASGEFNNYANRLASLAGVGQSAANTSAQLGQSYAGQVGNIAQNTAQTLGSSYQNQAAINGSLYTGLAGIGAGLLTRR